MEASMCGFGTEASARPGIRTVRKRATIATGACAEEHAQTLDVAKFAARGGQAGRVEHALFALTLGCLGCVWLGALLAEAVQAL